MDSYPSLHKQLVTKLVAIFVLFVISISMLFLAFYQRDIQLHTLFENKIPNTQQYIDLLTQAHENSLLMSEIVQLPSAELLSEKHQVYVAGLERLKLLNATKTLQISQIIKSMSQENESMLRLSANHERNVLLQQNAKLQLQLIINEIHLLIGAKESELAKLYQQITKDKMTDKVTVSRARAHAELVKTVTLLSQTLRSAEDLHVLFSRLNLHYSLDEFNYLTEQFREVFAQWQPIVEDGTQVSEIDKKLLSQLLSLNALLFEQQNTLAKWRGHIRIGQNYFTYLKEQQQRIEDLVTLTKPPKLTIQYFPQLPEEISVYATVKNFQLALIVISVLLALMLISLLRAIKFSVAKQAVLFSQITELAIENKAIPDNLIRSKETKLLAHSFAALTQPTHGESDYQKLALTYSHLQRTLLGHAKIAYFHFNAEQVSGFDQIVNLLHTDIEQTKKSPWRHYFAYSEQQKIIQAFKSSRAEKQIIDKEIVSKNGQVFNFIINTTENDTSGLLIKAQAHGVNEHVLSEIGVQHKHELAESKQSNIFYINELEQLVSRSILQNQNIVKEHDDLTLQVSRQLSKLLNWCEQKQAITTNATATPLDSVELIPLIESLAFNIGNNNKLRKNSVLVDFDQQLTKHAELNVELFSALLTKTAQLCLSDLLNSHLQLTIKLLDQNPSQQQIALQFKVRSQTMLQLPILVEQFDSINWQESKGNTPQSQLILAYLNNVMQALHAKNVGVVKSENGFDLQIELPIVHAQQSNVNNSEYDFAQKQFILLHGVESISETIVAEGITAVIKQAKGECESTTNVEYLQKLLSVKHLKQHSVAAVIVSAEQLKVNQQVILATIEQLPAPIKPKLMVLPAAYNSSLHRTGLYAQCQQPSTLARFAQHLSELLTTDKINNQVVSVEEFRPHRFTVNQVEVLFSAQDISNHQPLLSLLQWLGLQIHVTNQESSQQRLWQSGRYLILISEFTCTPFVKMSVGRNVKRAVFTLSDEKNSFDCTNLTAPFDLWKTAKLPEVNHLEAIIRLLSPWLKTAKKPTSDVKLTVVAKNEAKTSVNSISNIELDPTDKVADKAAAFDLIGYAKNQGSPELAVFMLDEYIADLTSNLAMLTTALAKKEMKLALNCSQNILLIASILVADNMSELTSLLIKEITDKDFEKAQHTVKRLHSSIDELIEYSEAI